MTDRPNVTYPPEMLPSPDEDDEAEVVVIDPDTRKQTVVYRSPPHHPTETEGRV